MTDRHQLTHWADTLALRDEVRLTDGSIGDLQMSLTKAVYQTVPVPYANCSYYTDITQPTPLLVGFLARIARRLGVKGVAAHACFHLDQGMGGGKSHALVGIWHMINSGQSFFASELGHAVADEATAGGHEIDLSGVIPVILMGDAMSPAKIDPMFGPGTDLFGRFLWLLFAENPNRMERWQHYTALGANKATLQAAFAEVNRPTLIVVDELMDYAMALTDQDAIGSLPGEQAFLNALTDAVDDQPQVALVVVMIRSDEDSAGYHPAAEDMREYLAARLRRNGETVTVTEPADFAQIIRRRLFARGETETAASDLADAFSQDDESTWDAQVYSRLGPSRTLVRLREQIVETYPFHPDLFELVSREWSVVQAFQRVRSTVAIFARTVLHWVVEHQNGGWAPGLIGPGDIPLHTDALEALLSSGVLAGNDRAIQGFRAVANTDIVRSGGGDGTAYNLDAALAEGGVDARQPLPATRMATACFAYSLVPRPQGARGATKAELLASIDEVGVSLSAAEEVFNALVSGPVNGGLGSLERMRPANNRGPERFYLSIKQTLNMYHANALTMVSNDDALERVWKRAQGVSAKGAFSGLIYVEKSDEPAPSIFHDVDGQENRLVILDPRQWSLLNGRDDDTRAQLDAAFGVSPGATATYAASMVIGLVNTQRRSRARDRARTVMAWERVVDQLQPSEEEYSEACARRDEDRLKLDHDVKAAYQHYAYLLRDEDGLKVQYKTIPDGRTSVAGQDVWSELVAGGRAVAANTLAPEYVGQLIISGNFGRDLTPKEVFTLPFANPAWPLVATMDELRSALYQLVTSSEWVLTDVEGQEIRPANSGQIQPASMQQFLRRRSSEAGDDESRNSTDDYTLDDYDSDASDDASKKSPKKKPSQETEDLSYEVTRIRLPLSSITDASKRESVWHLIRELASVVDPAKMNMVDIQMVGIEVAVTARVGDTSNLTTKADSIPAVTVSVEPEEDFL